MFLFRKTDSNPTELYDSLYFAWCYTHRHWLIRDIFLVLKVSGSPNSLQVKAMLPIKHDGTNMDAIFPAKGRRKYLQRRFYKNSSLTNSPNFFLQNQFLIQRFAHYHKKQIYVLVQTFYFILMRRIKPGGKCSQAMWRWKAQHPSGITTLNSKELL